MPASQLETRWSTRRGSQTRIETNDSLLQDEAARNCAACKQFAGLNCDESSAKRALGSEKSQRATGAKK